VSEDDRERRSGLPSHVERALADARARASGTKRALAPRSKQGRGLALVPVAVAAVMLALMMPRTAPPGDVPLPDVDERAITRVVAEDRALAARARAERLPTDALAVGTAFRRMQLADARQEADFDVGAARRTLDDAVAAALSRPEGASDLRALRALQLEAFVEATSAFEATGETSEELEALGGGFVRRMRGAGWLGERELVLTAPQLRVAFKVVWNALTGVEPASELALTLDEQRLLHSLYLTHPHVPEHRRAEIDAELASAKTPADCERARQNRQRAVELWRVEKIRSLGEIDPAYPTSYALGVAYYRAGRHDLAIERFRSWLDAHPEGAFALRARNHLAASVAAYGAF
jgi:tetratricopeptide (TPR) repeat protein